jgi:hypothetical protein
MAGGYQFHRRIKRRALVGRAKRSWEEKEEPPPAHNGRVSLDKADAIIDDCAPLIFQAHTNPPRNPPLLPFRPKLFNVRSRKQQGKQPLVGVYARPRRETLHCHRCAAAAATASLNFLKKTS